MKKDITKLKKGLQDEILTHVRRCFCKTCGGSGLNPKALASRINGKNIVDCMDMTVSDLLAFLKTINDPRGSSLAGQIAALSQMACDEPDIESLDINPIFVRPKGLGAEIADAFAVRRTKE